MVFSSLTFLFAFLPVVLVLYYVWNNRIWRNAVLLAESLVFYSWGEPRLLILMIAVAAVAYFGGIGLEHYRAAGAMKTAKAFYIAALVLILANLLVCKYMNFFADNISAVFGLENTIPEITLPIGISFYTFQILSYLIDLYRGEVKVQRNFLYLLLYVAFFPQLIAGPIVRYSTVEDEIRNRRENLAEAAAGLRRFCVGLGKKVLLANGVAQLAEMVYAGDAAVYGTLMYWLAAIAYTLQIYFDFSGYSDMAIGLGQLFGFHFEENFDHPYTALSVTDFWRKWHISLSSWFRDYVYIPLGGNRCGRWKWIRNILIVWLLTGFWHGASWNFLLWGLYYAVLLLAEKLVLHRFLERLPKVLRWLIAMFFVTVGWVIFNRTDFAQMWNALVMMFTWHPADLLEIVAANMGILESLLYLLPAAVCVFPLGRILLRYTGKFWESTAGIACRNLLCLCLFVLCAIFVLSQSYNPFIYFRF